MSSGFATQNICLSGQPDSDPIPLTSSTVSVQCSKLPATPPQAGGSIQIRSEASHRVKVQTLCNQQWELKRLSDNLITENENFLAYILHVKSEDVLRVMHKPSQQRLVVKEFASAIADLVFAHISYDMIACLEVSGVVTIRLLRYEENASDPNAGTINSELVLKIKREQVGPLNTLRVVWCELPFLTSESTESMRAYSPYFCVTLNDKCEVWDLEKAKSVQGESGNAFVSVGNHRDSCVEFINTHNGDILDVAFSPDESYLATCGQDGVVKCWSIEKTKCVHKLDPHESCEVSQMKFLDDLTHSTRYEAHTDSFWKFLLTLSRPRSEIKLWSCSDWGCLQSISFHTHSPPPPLLRLATDRSSRFLALWDINLPVLYLLDFSRDSSHFTTLGEFTLTQPILSLSIASTETSETSKETGILPSSTDLPEKYTLIALHAVESKCIQELTVRYSLSDPKGEATGGKFTSPVVHTLQEIEGSPTAVSDASDSLTEVTREENGCDIPQNSDSDENELIIPPGPGSGVESMKKIRGILNLPEPILSASIQTPPALLSTEEVLKVADIGASNYFADELQDIETRMEQEVSDIDNSSILNTSVENSEPQGSPKSSTNLEITSESSPDPNNANFDTAQQLSQIKQELLEQRKQNTLLNREISHLSTYVQTLNQQQSNTFKCLTQLIQTQNKQILCSNQQFVAIQQHQAHTIEIIAKNFESEKLAEKGRRDKLIATISSNLTQILTDHIEKLISNEVSRIVTQSVSNTFLKNVPGMLKDVLAEQMKAIETRLEDFLVQLLQRQDVIEKVGSQLTQAMMGPVKESQKKVFLDMALPHYEKCCKQMLQQLNDAVVRASQEYAREMHQCVVVIREQIEGAKKETGESESTTIGNDEVLQKCDQIATSIDQVPQLVCNEVQRILQAELAAWTQSLPPSSTQVSIEEIKAGIDKYLREGHVAEAFDLALTANNLEAVEYICGQVTPGEVLESDPPILNQALLLSLIQQLSFDLSSNKLLKIRYMSDAIHSIDHTHKHAAQVLRDLLQTLTQTSNQLTSAEPNSICLSKVNWLIKYVKKTVDSLD